MGCRQTNPSLLALLLLYVCCPKMAGFKEYGLKKRYALHRHGNSESSRIVHKSILIRTICLNRINALKNHDLKSSQLRNPYHLAHGHTYVKSSDIIYGRSLMGSVTVVQNPHYGHHYDNGVYRSLVAYKEGSNVIGLKGQIL